MSLNNTLLANSLKTIKEVKEFTIMGEYVHFTGVTASGHASSSQTALSTVAMRLKEWAFSEGVGVYSGIRQNLGKVEYYRITDHPLRHEGFYADNEIDSIFKACRGLEVNWYGLDNLNSKWYNTTT